MDGSPEHASVSIPEYPYTVSTNASNVHNMNISVLHVDGRSLEALDVDVGVLTLHAAGWFEVPGSADLFLMYPSASSSGVRRDPLPAAPERTKRFATPCRKSLLGGKAPERSAQMFGAASADSGSAQSPDGAGTGELIRFREASAPSPTAKSQDGPSDGGTFHMRDDAPLQFRPATGESSSSVVLVEAAPTAPGQKRSRDDADESDDRNKRRRIQDPPPDLRGDTSEQVMNEDEIEDAFADAFGELEKEEEEQRQREKEGDDDDERQPSASKSPKEEDEDDAVKPLDGTARMKVLRDGEIDDALADAFGDNDAEEEPEDVALPTERDSAEESAAKDGGQDGNVKDTPPDVATKVKDHEEGAVARRTEGMDAQTDKEKFDGEKTPAEGGKMAAEPSEDSKVAQVNRAKVSETIAEKKAVNGVDGDEAKDAKQSVASSSSVAEKNSGMPAKENEGEKGKESKSKMQPHDVESDEEDAPLDLAAMSAFEYEQVAKLNPIQLRRYEQYRRSDLKNAKVKKVLVNLNPALQKASEQYVIAVKGLAKLFVGDVVECAIEVRKQLGEKGALQPKHLREAYRRLRRSGVIPSTTDKSTAFS